MGTERIIQALTFFAYNQPGHVMDNMKAYKLLWLADRYQLRYSGRFLSGDKYYAMPFGPVPSDAKQILENKKTHLEHNTVYANAYIMQKGKSFIALKKPDLDVFSTSDIEILKKVLDTFGNKKTKDLSDFSHTFPEWLAYKDKIKDKYTNNSYPIDNVDLFFEDSKADETGFFKDDPETLALAKDYYHLYNRA